MNVTRHCKHSSYVICLENVEGRYSISTPVFYQMARYLVFLVSKESPIFVQDHSCTCFLQFDSILDVPFVIGSPDSRPIVKYWLDNWVIEQLEFLLLGKESSVLFSAGQVTSLFFFNVSHMVFPG